MSEAAELLPAGFRDELGSNPVTKAMVDRDFCLDDECLEAYARIAGQVGGGAAGAAACAAVGAAAVAQWCGVIGAWIGGVLAKTIAGPVIDALGKLGRARGQSLEEQQYDTFERLAPIWKAAPERTMAALTYAAERNALIQRLTTESTATVADVDALLQGAGAPSLDVGAVFMGWTGDLRGPAPTEDVATAESHYIAEVFRAHGLAALNGELAEPPRKLGQLGPLQTGPGAPPERVDPGIYWAEWRLARDLFGEPVFAYEVWRAQYLVTYPGGAPAPEGEASLNLLGQDAKALDVLRQWQGSMRSSVRAVRDASRRRGFIDVGQQGEARRIPRLRGASTSGASLVMASDAFRWLAESKSGTRGAMGVVAVLVLTLLAAKAVQ